MIFSNNYFRALAKAANNINLDEIFKQQQLKQVLKLERANKQDVLSLDKKIAALQKKHAELKTIDLDAQNLRKIERRIELAMQKIEKLKKIK
ncbi:hypothetical protein GOV04_04615 [Candidatus Woesearchaeota archaeon]|nr:hypothetical protein [Candidatus Woesearchaeota archaeon]